MTSIAFLLLGSNLGDRNLNLNMAAGELSKEVGQIVGTSSIYKTAAWGNTNQPSFYNEVVKIETQATAELLLAKVLAIERALGRERVEHWGARVIDIDILFYNNDVIQLPGLTIPHPEIANRRFTLVPLAELAGEYIHPVYQKEIAQLLQDCTDNLSVVKI